MLSRRTLLGWLGAGAFAFMATAQKRKDTMTPAAPLDEKRLQAYYQTNTKYQSAPVPTPLDRSSAITFVNTHANAAPPDKLRKLMQLAVFYDLQETAAAFYGLLKGGENQSIDIFRSAYGLIAFAWIGDPGRQAGAREYFHALQGRADVDLHRAIMLEVVEAFGLPEGTGSHRQWIQTAIGSLQGRLQPGVTVAQEKVKRLTEYLNIQLPLVDRTLLIRQRIEAMTPQQQIQPLVAYSLAIMKENTPPLSYWASMRILRLPTTLREPIAAEFYAAISGLSGRTGEDLYRARALRAAQYFGHRLSEEDSQWLAGQPDAGTDPLVLRPRFYPV